MLDYKRRYHNRMKLALALFATAAVLLMSGSSVNTDAPHYKLIVLPLDFYGSNRIDTDTSCSGINAQG